MNRPKHVIVHHSASSDNDELQYERIRWYHRYVRRWREIGYHRIYERVSGIPVAISGRPLNMTGAHAVGYNSRSIGVCFVGNFMEYRPDDELLHVGARDVAGLCDVLGIDTSAILPHRATKATACPGDAFPVGTFLGLVSRYRSTSGGEWSRPRYT